MKRLSTKYEVSLEKSLSLGEVLGWTEFSGSWYGFINHGLVELKQEDKNTILYSGDTTEEELEHFFNLETDYSNLQNLCTTEYEFQVLEHCNGARIIQQDLIPTILGCILMPRQRFEVVKQQYNWLCAEYGEAEKVSEELTVYDFPTLEALEFAQYDFGNKTYYFQSAVEKLLNDNALFMLAVTNKKVFHVHLQSYNGIGEKTANLIALHTIGDFSLVAIDTHIKQVIDRHYNSVFPKSKFKDLSGVMCLYMYDYEVKTK